MKDLVDALDQLSIRGTPRGADTVFEAAIQATRHMDPSLADRLLGSGPSHAADAPEYVSVLADAPHRRRPGRVAKIALGAAACVALLATGVLVANRVTDDSNASELGDVNPAEALPLARDALIAASQIGSRWQEQVAVSDIDYEAKVAASRAALPDCDVLKNFGLFPPTTKSVAARRTFTSGQAVDINQAVFVFATPEDASRAMEVIAGKTFMACWFSLFDRLAPLGRYGPIESATSQAWPAPNLAPHGDSQIIIGQRTSYVATSGPFEAHIINSFVQVGRAISWIAPAFGVNVADPSVLTNKVLAATADRLDEVFGS